MPRPSKGPRLYLRSGRKGREGRAVPPVYFIRDGAVERSTGFGPDQLSEAEQALAGYLVEKHQAKPVQGPAGRNNPDEILVAEVVAYYSAEHGPGGLDLSTFEGFCNQLLDWWSDKTLSEVKRSTCKAYAANRMTMPDARYKNPLTAPRVGSETARRELETLSAAIGFWHGEDQLQRRPTVWLPDKPESNRDALTRSQAAAMLWAAMGWRKGPDGLWTRLGPSAVANRRHLRRLVLIGLYSGSRPSVQQVMLWEESALQAWVDLDKGMVWRRGREEKDHKTKRRPVVRLSRRLLAHMRRWRRLDCEEEVRRRLTDSDFRLNSVIHHGGEPLAGKVRTGFEGIVRDAGLPPEITPHWLRHTAATWLMEQLRDPGDLWDAASYLGMTVATLEKHYGHHRADYQADTADRLGQGSR